MIGYVRCTGCARHVSFDATNCPMCGTAVPHRSVVSFFAQAMLLMACVFLLAVFLVTGNHPMVLLGLGCAAVYGMSAARRYL